MRLKITWMLLSAFGIPSSLLFQSCDKCKPDDPCEPILAINYQYSNQTVYSIATYRWDYDKEFVYELPARSQIEFEVDDGCINNVVPNFSTCPLIYADSIRIVFDNSRSYWLKHSDSVDVNILHHVNYDCVMGNRREDCLYTFTEKDYNYADPIEKED